MEKSDNFIVHNPSLCLLDSDVIINWLAKEETSSEKHLWDAPYKIIKAIEAGRIRGFSTLINILEVRFVLRRKKGFVENKIREDITKILELLEIIVPDETNLLNANSLQDKFSLSPFDAIILSAALTKENIVLITRDNALISVASKLLEAADPETFLNSIPGFLK